MTEPNTLALSACLLLVVGAAQADTFYSAHFNNGTGSSGDKNGGLYNWTSAVGATGTLDNSSTGAPASVGVSQGATAGVPAIVGSTSAGFFFSRLESAPGAMLLHTAHLTTSPTLQNAPQADWFRSESDGIYALTGEQGGDAARVWIDGFQVTSSASNPPSSAMVTFAGNAGTEEFRDVMELSDGTLLVAGTAENLDWTSAPKTELAPLGIPNRATGRTAFIMRLSQSLDTILGVWHLPAGQVHDIRWIKGTHLPGAATGDLYLSGACDTTSGDYFIARLNQNFIAANPTAFSWVRVAKSSSALGDNLGLQSWDVGGDGRVVFSDETDGNLRVFFLDAAGALVKLPSLRGSHWPSGVALDGANRQEGIGSDLPATAVSGVTFPSDLRSWTEPERLAILPDGNGKIKRGTWPFDLFVPVQDLNGGTSGTIQYGYTGYRNMGKYRIGGIAINRVTHDFSIGFNIQSRFWDASANKEQPDFEPAVISYSASGAMKWWSRLYHEINDANNNSLVDAGETQISSPDQYVDGLAIDYSASPNRLVVLARCHGNNTTNLWRGNSISATPGAQGFQNQFTGTEGNIHIGWVGKLRDTDGTLLHASYLAGYFRNTTLSQAAYTDANLDGWPSHNAGWPNLTTTRAAPGSVRVDAAGRVYVVGSGPRMVTTTNAWQKLPKITTTINQGISPWNNFARVYAPNLDTLTYSSAVTGEWTYPEPGAQPVGAGNTDLYGIFPITNGLVAVGRLRNEGNPVPAQNVPSWGSGTPSGISALFARLPFTGGGTAGSSLPSVSVAPSLSPNPVTGTTGQLSTLASDPNDPESALVYTWSVVSAPAGASVAFSANGTNAAKQSTATFNRAGSYTMRMKVSNTQGRSVEDEFPVIVQSTSTVLSIVPSAIDVGTFNSTTFSARITDQFGQYELITAEDWFVAGGGSISPAGVFTAGPTAGGPHGVTASFAGFTGNASVTVIPGNTPRIQLPVTSLTQSVQSGGSTSRPLHIHNIGSQPLSWSAAAVLPTGGEITTFQTSTQSGGPAFNWIDISSGSTDIFAPTGSNVEDNSNAVFSFPSEFTFPYYGTTFNQVRVCSNAFLTFSSSTITPYSNRSLPTLTETPGNLVAVAWHDWVVDSSSWVRGKLVDPETLVITWNNIRRFNPNTQRATFQCILKSNGDIIIQVKSFTPTDRVYTMGIQNSNATKAVEASFNPAIDFIPTGANSNFAVRFAPSPAVPAWLSMNPASGTIAGGASGLLDLAFNSAGLSNGNHQATVVLATNDPLDPLLQIPVTLTVGSAAVAPNAPRNLGAQSASVPGSVNLTWTGDGGSPAGHRVEYRAIGASNWTSGPSFGASALTGTVPGLLPGTTFEFRLLATNAGGDSMPSNIAAATPWSAIEAWRYEHFGSIENDGEGADGEDPDGDGLVNLLEFALHGGDPLASSTSVLPAAAMTEENGSSYLTLSVAKNTLASDLSYVIETCHDMIDWNHGAGYTVMVGETEGSLIVRDAIPFTSAARRFIRLKVIRP